MSAAVPWSDGRPVLFCALLLLIAGCPPAGGDANNPPTASAGAAQTVDTGASVTLDASGSSDPDGDTLTFSWRQTLGPAVSLSSTAAPIANFTAPAIGTTLMFELTVSDGQSTSTASTTVSVRAVDPSARVVELVQPSLSDDPAYTGRFPPGWTFPDLPPGPQKVGVGSAGWSKHVVGGDAVEVDLAPGGTHTIQLQLAGISILMGSAKWSGTTDLLNVTLTLDGNLLTTGKGYSTGLDRGGSVLTFVTATGGSAGLTVTNTSDATVKVRMVLGALAL